MTMNHATGTSMGKGETAGSPRLRNFVANILLSGVAMIVALVIGELALGLLWHPALPYRAFQPGLKTTFLQAR